jgi:hypothetical protein
MAPIDPFRRPGIVEPCLRQTTVGPEQAVQVLLVLVAELALRRHIHRLRYSPFQLCESRRKPFAQRIRGRGREVPGPGLENLHYLQAPGTNVHKQLAHQQFAWELVWASTSSCIRYVSDCKLVVSACTCCGVVPGSTLVSTAFPQVASF